MLATLNTTNKPKAKHHIPALGRMILGAIEDEKDDLIEAIDAAQQPTMELAYVEDGEQLIGFWNEVEDDLRNGVDEIDFALDDE